MFCRIVNRMINVFVLSLMYTASGQSQCSDVYIAGLMDGHTMSATPKFVLLCATADIPDLSIYSVGSANNGTGTTSPGEFTFPDDELAAGDCITLATEVPMFLEYFGCNPTYTDGSVINVNGDDAIELFCNGVQIDVYGDVDVDGTGQPWEYVDGWAVRLNASTFPATTFNVNDWVVAAMQTPVMHHFNDNGMMTVDCPDCNIVSVTSGDQSVCDPITNTYSQEIIIEYTGGPMSGNLVVNNQLFALTASPQTVTLSGLNSDGASVDVNIEFSDLPGCNTSVGGLFTAPTECLIIPAQCNIENIVVQDVSCGAEGIVAEVCFDYENPISAEVSVAINGLFIDDFTYPTVSGGCIDVITDSFINGAADLTIMDAASAGPIFISEFHYDNVSTDVGEFIEITAPVGTDLTGYRLVLYNGSDNSEYETINLSGVITGTPGACGVMAFDADGIQNGPDAIALVNTEGEVIEFISYEGILTAADGPAIGLVSEDIGVVETTSASVTTSVSLVSGNWMVTDPNSRGALNVGATCIEACEAMSSFTAPLCCSDFALEAVAFCEGNGASFRDSEYYVSVSNITGGQNTGEYSVTIQGVTINYTNTPIVFGPFVHSGIGNAVQDISVVETMSGCTYETNVVETLCVDIDGILGPDNDIAFCQCEANSNNTEPGVILSQVQPGTFMAGGTTDLVQSYLLTEQSMGLVTIADFNGTGLFENLGGSQYFVFAINFDRTNSADLQADLIVGGQIDLQALFNNDAPYDDECFSICGPAEYLLDCSPNQGTLGCNDHLNVSVNSACQADLSPDALLEGTIGDPSNYGIEITNDRGVVLDANDMTLDEEDDIRNFLGQDLIFTVTDFCSGNACWGLVTFEDKTPPVINCDCPVGGEDLDGDGTIDGYAEECIFNCYEISLIEGDVNGILPDDISDFINNNIEDNCFDYSVDDVSFEDDLTDLGACAGSLLRRTWNITFEDFSRPGSNNSVSCTREYLFRPIDLTTIDTADGSRPVSNVLFLPTYQTITECQNGTDPDDIRFAVGVESAFPHIFINNRPFPIEGNFCNLSVSYSDTNFPGCGMTCNGNMKVVREWTILDWCTSDIIRYQQIIQAQDDLAPTIVLGDNIETVVDGNSCTARVELPDPVILGDFCEGVVSYFIEGSSGDFSISGNEQDGFIASGVLTGVNEIYYAAEDCCGNVGRDTLLVTVLDDNSPSCIAVERVTVGLQEVDLSGTGDQLGFISALSVDNGSFDFCTDVTLELRRVTDDCRDNNMTFGDIVSFCCEDITDAEFSIVEVELRATDANGNSCLVRSMIYLKDNSMDMMTCPEGRIVDCLSDISDLSQTGLPTADGICGEIILSLDTQAIVDNTAPATKPANTSPQYDIDGDGFPDAIPPFDEACGFGALSRTFSEGSEFLCEQFFVVLPVDQLDPNDIIWPQDMITDCNVVDPGVPIFSSGPCGRTGFTIERDTVRVVNDACYKIFNLHTVIDWCLFDLSNGQDGIYSNQQIITVIDDQAPIVSADNNLEFEISSGCSAPSIELEAIAMDNINCSIDLLDWLIEVDYFSDGIIDEVLNSISSPGDTLTTVLSNVPASKTGHTIRYIVEDACENIVTIERSFTVIDRKSPTPYCINVASSAFGADGVAEIWARDFDLGATDNCSDSENLRFTFTEVLPPSSDGFYNPLTGALSDQSSYEQGIADQYNSTTLTAGRIITADDVDDTGRIQFNIYVWDECDNADFCVVQLVFDDMIEESNSTISGRIYTEMGEAVQSVKAEINSNGYSNSVESNNDGIYAFYELPTNSDYEIEGEKNDDYLNGVSTFDLILIQKHILNDELLDSPYKMIAADVSNDKQITAIDLIQLRKLILGVHDAFQNNGSWKFVDESDDLTIDQAWNYNESIVIDNLNTEIIDQDFIAVKIGDVNNSTIPNVVSQSSELRRNKYIEFTYEDRYVEEGESTTINFNTDNENLYGYQLSFITDGIEILSCSGRDMFDDNYNIMSSTAMTISHNTDYPIDNNSAIISIDVRARQSGMISEMISINSKYLKTESYVGTELDIYDIVLSKAEEVQFELYQNEPNPFTQETNISFELPESGAAIISLYTVNGQLLRTYEIDGIEGYNAITVDKKDIGATGLVYYKLESNGHTATKHMILID